MSNASSVRVGSKAKLGGNADVKVMSPLMAAAHRQTLEEQVSQVHQANTARYSSTVARKGDPVWWGHTTTA